MDERERLNEITQAIIGCAFRVHNTPGIGFLEKVYENALAHELRKLGYEVLQHEPIKVMYDEVVVGEYLADVIVAGGVVIEVKAVQALDDVHLAQCLNYLKATGLRICLLMNFHEPRLAVKRIVNNF